LAWIADIRALGDTLWTADTRFPKPCAEVRVLERLNSPGKAHALYRQPCSCFEMSWNDFKKWWSDHSDDIKKLGGVYCTGVTISIGAAVFYVCLPVGVLTGGLIASSTVGVVGIWIDWGWDN
jgi:hypothetical protein